MRELWRIAIIARSMLDKKISYLEGARCLSIPEGLRDDEDFLPFLAVDSVTDRFPLGKVRELWDPDALVRLQPEIDKAEAWAAETLRDHCQRLVDRYGPDGIRRQVAQIARAMLDRKIAFIEGAHQIAFLNQGAQLPEADPDLVVLLTIDEQCADLPPNDGRENWPLQKLMDEFPEIGRAEEWARNLASPSCQALIARFGSQYPTPGAF